MWFFRKKNIEATIQASSVEVIDGVVTIDVRGQTCPGYLLAINKEVDKLEDGSVAKLLITYAPCHDDVKAWCKERCIEFKNITKDDDMWTITIKKQLDIVQYSPGITLSEAVHVGLFSICNGAWWSD